MIHERGMIMILAVELIINHSVCQCNKTVLHADSGSVMSAGTSWAAGSHQEAVGSYKK